MRAHVLWAGRSVVDRVLGMDEAAGSIPARSTRFLMIQAIIRVFLKRYPIV